MLQHILIAFALAMDCFAVSVACAVIVRKKAMGLMLRLAFLFGLFQGLMPLLGWLLTQGFSRQIQAYDHWIAFALLAFIGGRMIADAFKEDGKPTMNPADFRTQILLAVATSIDALAVGISYACTGYDSVGAISLPLLVIGLVSLFMSVLGYLLGLRFGAAVNRVMRPELLGGIILIGIGLRILLEHLGLLAALAPAQENIPAVPDYTLSASWYEVDRGAEVDLFYISSTETVDYTLNGRPCHYANAAVPDSCGGILREMIGVDRRLSASMNFISPFYRQITLESYTDSLLAAQRIRLPLEDIRQAFRYYVEHTSHPFILAGFSQGAHLVIELLKEMSPEVFERMVAAYVIGWYITPEELADYPNIRPARGDSDTGVTICYNSLRSPECGYPVITGHTAVGINPVNWRTDATPALMSNGLTATLDTLSHNLMVEGYTDSSYIRLPYFPEGCYHIFEIVWYSDYLRENMALRSQAYLSR